MMQMLKIIFLLLGSLILQTTLIAQISIFGSKPDLTLVLVVSVALLKGPLYGELTGFAAGFLCDLLSGGPILGIQAFSKVIVGYFTGFVSGRFYSDNFITQLASSFAATLVVKIITSVYLSLLFVDPQFLHFRFSGLILAALLNSILVIPVFWILKKLIHKHEN